MHEVYKRVKSNIIPFSPIFTPQNLKRICQLISHEMISDKINRKRSFRLSLWSSAKISAGVTYFGSQPNVYTQCTVKLRSLNLRSPFCRSLKGMNINFIPGRTVSKISVNTILGPRNSFLKSAKLCELQFLSYCITVKCRIIVKIRHFEIFLKSIKYKFPSYLY